MKLIKLKSWQKFFPVPFISILLFLAAFAHAEQEVLFTEKDYVGKWVCTSRTFTIYHGPPEKRTTEQPCLSPLNSMTIESSAFNELLIYLPDHTISEPVKVTQSDLDKNQNKGQICFKGIIFPRCISMIDKDTLFYSDQTGGNATITIVFKRQH